LWIGNGLRSVGYVNTSIHVVIAQWLSVPGGTDDGVHIIAT
jgi:hypothetical protein